MSRATVLVLAVALLASVPLGLAIFGGASGDGGDGAAAGPGGAALQVDGTVDEVRDAGIVFRPFEPVDGEGRLSLAVRPEDAAAVDLPHLTEHAALGTPVKLFYERAGGELFAIGSLDLPFTPGTRQPSR